MEAKDIKDCREKKYTKIVLWIKILTNDIDLVNNYQGVWFLICKQRNKHKNKISYSQKLSQKMI